MSNRGGKSGGGGGAFSLLSFGEAAGVLKQDINKVCVKSRGPLMPTLTPRTAVSVLTFRNEKTRFPAAC